MPRSKTRKDKKRNRKGRKTMRGGANTVKPAIQERIDALNMAANKSYARKDRSSVNDLDYEHLSRPERINDSDSLKRAQHFETVQDNRTEDLQQVKAPVAETRSEKRRKLQEAKAARIKAETEEEINTLGALKDLDAYLNMKAASVKKGSTRSEVATVIRKMEEHARKVREQKLAQEVAPEKKKGNIFTRFLGRKKKSSTRKNNNPNSAERKNKAFLYGGKH